MLIYVTQVCPRCGSKFTFRFSYSTIPPQFCDNCTRELMKCPYLKPDPSDPDCYICGKIVGACYCGKPKECPAFQRLLAQIFDDEKENNQ